MSYPESSARYDYGAALFALLFSVGGYVDGWAHNRFEDIESFFTPWHAVLYGGFALMALYLLIPAVRNIRAGKDWQHSLPRGYATSLVGVAIFAIAGACDMIWHIVFGIEANIDAFMSPPHVALFASSLLITTGPVRAIVARNSPDRSGWAENGAFVIALLAVLMTLGFIMQPWIANGSSDAVAAFAPKAPGMTLVFHRVGTAAIIMQAALLAGVMLYMVKIERVPKGAFTVLLFASTGLLTEMRGPHIDPELQLPQIAVGLLAGILADALYAWLHPSASNIRGLYAFACLAPGGFCALYFAAVHLFAGGSWWSHHMVAGSIVYAAAIGAAFAALVVRPEDDAFFYQDAATG